MPFDPFDTFTRYFEAQAEADRRLAAELAKAVPWTPNIRWKPRMVIQAETYNPLVLYDVEATWKNYPWEILRKEVTRPPRRPVGGFIPPRQVTIVQDTEHSAVSADGRWLFAIKLLDRGTPLRTVHGSQTGSVVFDGTVIIPVLYERMDNGEWPSMPWMSITPMEILTLREGTKLAKGTVVVAGLGLGHQLIEVSKRPQVKKIILIEKSESLVNFALKQVELDMGRPVDEVYIGDAYEILPRLSADVALIDIFPRYGNNGPACEHIARTSPGLKKVWCWGTAVV
jgi:hypothetical protein